MRTFFVFLLFAVTAYTTNAQLRLLPQLGVENPVTKISFNNGSWIKPLSELQPQPGLRLDYKFKNGISPFAGISSSRSLISYNFENPDAGGFAYRAVAGKMQLQLLGGLSYSTKSLFFNKPPANRSSNKRSGCCSKEKSTDRSGCCNRNRNSKQIKAGRGAFVRIQPFAGVGYIPATQPGIVAKTTGTQTTYTYNAGSMKTTLITGVGFEFGKNSKSSLVLNINYFKGLNNNSTALTTESGGKTVTTALDSKASGWSATLGVPIRFASHGPGAAYKKRARHNPPCEQYRLMYKCRYRSI